MVQNNILCNVFFFFLLLFVFCVLKWPLRGCYVLFFACSTMIFPCFVVCCAECRKQYCRSCSRGTSAAEGDSALIASVNLCCNFAVPRELFLLLWRCLFPSFCATKEYKRNSINRENSRQITPRYCKQLTFIPG